ncbi:cysteine ABC transporter substrate-binding protein [uncultured Campylobacter sp.]|uniref:cysteine ABC transporter substrate-binding protein n=1 Tax=uncultured Campylobacter sp. TaxID=218934 RepID=UPI002635E295|nr:cysteine ABC transporter substrate-binding protein [uncultured Campylobacter sp.]
MKKLGLTIFALFTAFMIVACGDSSSKSENNSSTQEANATSNQTNSSLERIKNNGVIRIGVFADKPPFGFVDERGENQGYDIYFAKRIAKELLGDENKVQFVTVEAANRVEFLKSDKVDLILANFTQTPEREEQVDFTLPYMKVSLGVAVPSDLNVSSVEDIKDLTLILNKGTTADAYFTLNYPDIKNLKFDQNTEAYEAFSSGKGQAFSHDNTLLFAWVKDKPQFKVAIKELGNQDVIAGAVKKGDAELKQFVDDLITKLGNEKFFTAAYEATLKDAFTDDIKAEDIVIEGGKL